MQKFHFDLKKSKMTYLYYVIIFLALAGLIFGTYKLTGYSLIQSHDPAEQHLPVLESYRNLLGSYLQHPFQPLQMWSWKLGLGSDQIQTFAYYVTGDVFAYITLLFPASAVVTVYQYTLILRLFCVGLSFVFLARHFNLTNSALLSGSIVYTFTSFSLYSSAMQPFFLTPFIIFPLLIVGIEKILQGAKPHFFIFIFSWMFISNFYFSVILGIGSLLYLILRYVYYYRKTLDFFKTAGTFLICTVISLLISAFIMLPSIIAVFSSTRSGGLFANGLTLFPAYYYINLPAQLLASGESAFWVKIGFSSLATLTLFHLFYHRKQYPLIITSFLIGLTMLLFPMFGALFNGFQSPSNRWILLLFVPFSLGTAFFIDSIKKITTAEIKYLSICLGIYLLLVTLPFYITGETEIFIPIIFLLLFFITLILYRQNKRVSRIMLGLLLLNVAFTGISFASPFTNFYSKTLIPTGGYQKLTTTLFHGLDKSIPKSDSFRASTISHNYNFGSNYMLRNNFNNDINLVNSYYSIQNGAIGKFSNSLQNAQYNNNIPIENFDDRTVVNNFFGVKYLFVNPNEPNASKIPYGYNLTKSKTTSGSKPEKTSLYSTKNNFPLIYWQSAAISNKDYSKLSATDKERHLSKAVTVPDMSDLDKASAKTDTKDIAFSIVKTTTTGQKNKVSHVVKGSCYSFNPLFDSYTINLKDAAKYQDSELHVSLSDIKHQPLTSSEQINQAIKNNVANDNNKLLDVNGSRSARKSINKQLSKGTSGTGYTISLTSGEVSNSIEQLGVDNLSFFKIISDTTLNMGYLKTVPNALDLNFSEAGNYSFKIKVTAVPLGKQYTKEVENIQKNKLDSLKFSTNKVSGSITTNKTGVLTSSIPYSTGWTATDNGRPIPIIKTNEAFLGLKLQKGVHHVAYNYKTPGLSTGIKLSILGFIIWVFYALLIRIWLKQKD